MLKKVISIVLVAFWFFASVASISSATLNDKKWINAVKRQANEQKNLKKVYSIERQDSCKTIAENNRKKDDEEYVPDPLKILEEEQGEKKDLEKWRNESVCEED